jgi:hypothetical protein
VAEIEKSGMIYSLFNKVHQWIFAEKGVMVNHRILFGDDGRQ